MLAKFSSKFFFIALISVCILMPCFSDDEADRWFWPLGEEAGKILLRPGYVENPVHGNTIANNKYYINGEYGSAVYAPENGIINRISLFHLPYPDAVSSWSWSDIEDFKKTKEKMNDPLMIESNLSTFMGIKLDNGKTIWIEGLENLAVTEGERVERGDILGTLGYMRTFSTDPCLNISLSTSSGKVDESLGMLLAGEDNSAFFSTLKKIDFSYKPDKKLTREKALEAWDIFSQAIAEDHPALLDEGIKKTSLEQLQLARLTIENDITVHELRLLMRNTLSYLNCVHTKVRTLDTQYYADFFPLDLIIQDGVCYVRWDRREIKEIPAGSIIDSINNKSISEWMEILIPLAGSDSVNQNVRREQIEGNVSSYLEGYISMDEKIYVTGHSPQGEKFDAALSRIPIRQLGKYSWPAWMYEEEKTFEIINTNTALMRIPYIDMLLDKESFTSYFKEIEEKKITNVIIDLRGNGGGELENESFFLSFFYDESFQLGLNNELRHSGAYASFKNSMNMGSSNNDVYPEMLDDFQKNQDGRLIAADSTWYTPAPQYRFNGKVYILVDSYCASASVHLARRLAEKGALVIGTETSGGYYSCNAEKYNQILLGETGLQLRQPLFRCNFTGELNADIPPHRGLIPHHIVEAALEDKLNNTDTQFDAVLALIEQIEKTELEEALQAKILQQRKMYVLIGASGAGVLLLILVILRVRKNTYSE